MTGCFGDFGTARRTMVVWTSEVPRLKIVLPHRVRLLTFAMILLVGSTEVHRMWSPEARVQDCRRLSFIRRFILWRFIGLLLLRSLVSLMLLLLLLLLFNTTWYRF